MKGINTWSFLPYRPFLFDVGDIYICRIAPGEDNICVEWLGEEWEYSVFIRKCGEEAFSLYAKTTEKKLDICGLTPDTDYEFYVEAGEKKSRIRIARCGESVGVVVNYLHPDDNAYSFSGRFLCSPSLLRHPDGYLLASMDVYESGQPQNLTLIFRSDDNGESWYYLSELMPCFWGKLFLHKGDVYMLSCSTEYGDLLISRSNDGAKSFASPTVLLRGSNGKAGNVGVHKNPQNIVIYNGRLYNTFEWGSWQNKEYYHAASVMSCGIDDDLCDPASWHFTPPLKYDPQWNGVSPDGFKGTIEGTLCVSPDGELYNVMRYQTGDKRALVYKVDTEDPDAPLTFSHAIDFPGNLSKFMIKYDAESGKYYSIVCRRIDDPKTNRNLLSLISSTDLLCWKVDCDLIDKRFDDPKKVGFQYVDFDFDGDDIIFLCRTAMNNADTFHNSNYSTFHRVKDFRKNN